MGVPTDQLSEDRNLSPSPEKTVLLLYFNSLMCDPAPGHLSEGEWTRQGPGLWGRVLISPLPAVTSAAPL